MSLDKRRKKDYEPPIGDLFIDPDAGRNRYTVHTYADLNGLLKALNRLFSENAVFQQKAEQQLGRFALRIDEQDQQLVQAHEKEWPTELGSIKDYVSYNHYKALRFRNSAASNLIRSRFEEAARDITGTAALDLLMLSGVINKEATLIREFANGYIGDVSDSSEFRTIEQFQDWVISAVGFTRKFSSFLETGVQNQVVNPREIERATDSESRHGQALFKVRLNKENDIIEHNFDVLQRNFSEFSEVFYSKFLAPAVDYRLKVGVNQIVSGGTLNRSIKEQSDQLDNRLRHALVDQMRRRIIFEEKTEEIFEAINRRDQYRQGIVQLSQKGKALPTSGPNTMIMDLEEPAESISFFSESEYSEGRNLSFDAAHQILSGREDPLAHPQYLNKYGDILEGEILFDDNAKIDGVRPGLHAHTGNDGTVRIKGRDIEWNTLTPESIDPDAQPPTPTSLMIASFQDNVVPPGVTSIDIDLEWEGEPGLTYEVRVALIGDAIDDDDLVE